MGRPIVSEEPSAASRRRRFAVRSGVAAVLTGTVVAGLLVGAGSASAQPSGAGQPRTTFVSDQQIAPSCSAPSPTAFCTERDDEPEGTAAVAPLTGVGAPRGSAGPGYLQLGTPSSTAKAAVLSQEFTGRRLSEIDDLRYWTYVTDDTNRWAPALRIEIDPNKQGVDDDYTSLVWEPLYARDADPVGQGRWQQWRPSSSRGGWWATLDEDQNEDLFFPARVSSLRQVKEALPDAVVLRVGVNQGSGNPGLVAGADLLQVNRLTYDFDSPVTATSSRSARPDVTTTLSLPATVPSELPDTDDGVLPPRSFLTTLTVSNAGRAATGQVRTTLNLPAGLTVVHVDGVNRTVTGQLEITDPTVLPNASVRHQIIIRVDQNARRVLPLTATARPVAFDQNPANNIAWAVTTTRR